MEFIVNVLFQLVTAHFFVKILQANGGELSSITIYFVLFIIVFILAARIAGMLMIIKIIVSSRR